MTSAYRDQRQAQSSLCRRPCAGRLPAPRSHREHCYDYWPAARIGRRRAVHVDAHRRAGGDGDFHIPAQFLGDGHSRRHRAAGADRHVRGAVRARLQPRQSLPDGAVNRGRLRGRRRRGRDREHRAAYGGRPLVWGRVGPAPVVVNLAATCLCARRWHEAFEANRLRVAFARHAQGCTGLSRPRRSERLDVKVQTLADARVPEGSPESPLSSVGERCN
jgi:hypothetical protein